MSDHAIWAYPWDLHDLGPALLPRLRDLGLTHISLAASYHAGRFLQPGNPRRRVYFPQDGTVYYRPDPARWQGHLIQPQAADIVATEGCQMTTLIRARDHGGLAVSAWTVCLHNTRLGLLHPDHVTRTAHGDANVYALCPSSPAVIRYVTGLVSEITETFAPDRIEIESSDFMGFSHGYHHEKDGLGLLTEDMFLLGLCFCAHCQTAAQAAGVDAGAARRTTADLLDAAFARALPAAQFADLPPQGSAAFAAYPALTAYLAWRSTPVTRLMAAIRAAAAPATQVLLIDAEGSASTGVNLPDIIPHIDGVLHCAYHTAQDRIAPLMAHTRSLLGPDKSLIAGLLLTYPAATGPDHLAARATQALLHADGLNFYNLGLVPPARLDWIKACLP